MQHLKNFMDFYEGAVSANYPKYVKDFNDLVWRQRSDNYYPLQYYRRVSDSEVSLLFLLPGYDKDSVDCSVTNNCLKLELKQLEDSFVCKKGVYLFQLPKEVDIDNVNVKISNGVLEVIFQNAKKKEIKLKINS